MIKFIKSSVRRLDCVAKSFGRMFVKNPLKNPFLFIEIPDKLYAFFYMHKKMKFKTIDQEMMKSK